ncbi:MAG: SMI1/KNR4 family protein [Clostridia bacterium]|nr:SMI1/KNR4 family protein [Clostridia bacterium]
MGIFDWFKRKKKAEENEAQEVQARQPQEENIPSDSLEDVEKVSGGINDAAEMNAPSEENISPDEQKTPDEETVQAEAVSKEEASEGNEPEAAEPEAAEPEAAAPEVTEDGAIVIEEEAPEVFEADVILEAEPDPMLSDMDFTDFWHDTKESERRHISSAPDWRIIRDVEEELGYKLPASYIELMKNHNGGLVNRCWFPLSGDAKEFSDFVQITGFFGIGREAPYSLLGRFGSRFLLEGIKNHEEIQGIAISNVISPARGLIILDYSECRKDGEPRVCCVDYENGEVKPLAKSFEAFARGLKASCADY